MRLRSAITLSLLAFGLSFLEAAPPADKWESEISRFDKLDQKHPPAEHGIVFVGSSSIRLWDLKKSFPKSEALNRGFGGSELADSVHYVDRLVLRHQPKIVVVYAGDNDIAHGKTPEEIASDFREFVAAVRKELPATKIVYIAIKPSLARWKLAEPMRATNAKIAGECKMTENCEFVDVWPMMLNEEGTPKKELFLADGLHMNDAGYKIWAKLLAPHLE